MSNFNKTLNTFAEKLEKFHIKSPQSLERQKEREKKAMESAMPVPAKSAKKVTVRRTNYLRKNATKQRGKTAKSKKENAISRRRKEATLRLKTARSIKAKSSRAQRKLEEMEKAKELIIEGKTRGQKKSNVNMK